MTPLFWSSFVLAVTITQMVECAGNSNHRTVYLSDMKQCPGKDDLPIYCNITVERGNRTQNYLSGDILVKERFPTGFKGKNW